VDGRKKPVERAQKHRDGMQNDDRWRKDSNRKKILYQQPAAENRAFFEGDTVALVSRNHALVFGRNV